MTARSVMAVVCCLIACRAVQAAPAPFDMSPERNNPEISEPAGPLAGSKPAAQAPAQPKAGQPDASPLQAPAPRKASSTGTDEKHGPAEQKSPGAVRYLVPSSEMTLYGETATRAWSIHLTPAEAAARTLDLGYENSIVVAPEASQLVVRLNGVPVVDRSVDAAGGVRNISVPVPSGLLHAGANKIRIETSLRHRTDCTVDSTYQLWTRIDPARTYLTYQPGTSGRYSSLDDIKAVGVDDKGRTRFDIVVPALDQPAASAPLFRLAEGLAIHAGMPNQSFSVTSTMPKAGGAGELTVVMGTASELADVVPSLPDTAISSPVAAFVPTEDGRNSVLVISGPSWNGISAAVDNIVAPLDRPAGPRDTLLTQSWHAPDAPVLYGGNAVRFSELGVRTQSGFSGRRYRTSFYFGIPSDFFASSYGHATILLDAAYSSAVEPGSRINIYVNGHIASTYPISAKGGAILRHMPIKVTMQDFRPGLNVMSLEAIVKTKDDERCLPGATAGKTPRFALFDTSELVVPDYARIAQRPNLSALSGTGFPYNRSDGGMPLVMNSRSPEILSATATFLARMALAAGRPIPVSPTLDVASLSDQNALFIGPIDEMQPAVLGDLGISETTRSEWADADGPATNEATQTSKAFKDWRERLRGGHWYGQVSSLEDWLNRNFDISLASLRFAPKAAGNFVPDRNASLLIAQASNPARNATWTMVSAPTTSKLVASVNDMTRQRNWPDIAGRITTYKAKTDRVSVEPVSTYSFVGTQDTSLANYRLIAANWLSSNTLTYAALVAIVSVLLGVATSALLARLGRRS